MKEPVPIGPGPWGGDGGKPWDDGVYTGVRQMYITRTDDFIGSVQMEYDRSGKSVWSTKHGNGGQQQITITHRVKFSSVQLSCVMESWNSYIIYVQFFLFFCDWLTALHCRSSWTTRTRS